MRTMAARPPAHPGAMLCRPRKVSGSAGRRGKRPAMHRWLVLLVLAACGGGGGSTTYENDARAALNGGDMPKAIRVAEDGLAQDAVKKDPAAAWRLEQIRLDALATSGKGTDVKKELDRLAAAYPKQVSASLYRSLADKAKTVNDLPGAIEILTAGD